LSPGQGVCEMIWNAPAPEAAFPPTDVADERSVSGVTSIGRVQPEGVVWATTGAEVAASPAPSAADALPANDVARSAMVRAVGANNRTIALFPPSHDLIDPFWHGLHTRQINRLPSTSRPVEVELLEPGSARMAPACPGVTRHSVPSRN